MPAYRTTKRAALDTNLPVKGTTPLPETRAQLCDLLHRAMVQGIEHRAEPLRSPKGIPKRNRAPKWSPACPRGYCLRGNLCITPAWSPRHQTCPWGCGAGAAQEQGWGWGAQQKGSWYKKQALENTSDTPAVTLLPDASHMWPSLQKGSESPKTQPPERCPWGSAGSPSRLTASLLPLR